MAILADWIMKLTVAPTTAPVMKFVFPFGIEFPYFALA
jgi:hypothetical protein